MSLFYRMAYAIGFAPWEHASVHGPAAEQVAALFDREQAERNPPYGRALDLGCGTGYWAIDLAKRGWQVTGIDFVASAVKRARARAEAAGVLVRFIDGDITAMRAAGIKPEFQFVWDFGAVHGLTQKAREAVGEEVTAVTAPGATMVMVAWKPGRRGPLPRGASGADIESAFPAWKLINVDPFDVSGLPVPLRSVEPHCYRFRRS